MERWPMQHVNTRPVSGNGRRGQVQGDAVDYKPLTAAELMAMRFDNPYLIPGMLAAGQPCLVFGPQKSLKTSILLDLAVSLALGESFLGYFPVAKAVKVAVMSGESGLAVIQETLCRIVNAAGYEPNRLTNLIVTDRLPRFGQAGHAKAMRRFIRDNELEVVVVDPAYLAMADAAQDPGNIFAQGRVLSSINELFSETGATPVLCHHAKKSTGPDQYTVPELTNVAWSGFAEWARQWIMVGRRERYVPGSGAHRLWLSVGGSAGHSGEWALNVDEGEYSRESPRSWRVSLQTPSDARQSRQERAEEVKHRRQAEALEKAKRRVLEVMRQFPAGETARVMRERCGLNDKRFDRVVQTLLTEGLVESAQICKGARKYPGFRLKAKDDTCRPIIRTSGTSGTSGTQVPEQRCSGDRSKEWDSGPI